MFIEVTRETFILGERGRVTGIETEQVFINTEHIISFASNAVDEVPETRINFDNGEVMYVAHTPILLMAKINGHDC
jgi:hypothetical protein